VRALREDAARQLRVPPALRPHPRGQDTRPRQGSRGPVPARVADPVHFKLDLASDPDPANQNF